METETNGVCKCFADLLSEWFRAIVKEEKEKAKTVKIIGISRVKCKERVQVR